MHFKCIVVVVFLYYVTDATDNTTIITETKKLLVEKIGIHYISNVTWI